MSSGERRQRRLTINPFITSSDIIFESVSQSDNSLCPDSQTQHGDRFKEGFKSTSKPTSCRNLLASFIGLHAARREEQHRGLYDGNAGRRTLLLPRSCGRSSFLRFSLHSSHSPSFPVNSVFHLRAVITVARMTTLLSVVFQQ